MNMLELQKTIQGETKSFVTCFETFAMPFCLQQLLLLLANLFVMVLVFIQIYKRLKISMSIISKKLNMLYMLGAQTILFEIQNIYRPYQQTYYIMYWFQNVYYCYLVYYFCLKVIKSYQQEIVIKKKHIRVILFIFWFAYTCILIYNFVQDSVNPSVLCKQSIFGYTRGINFILTFGFIILGKLLQKRVDTIIYVSGVENEQLYSKQMDNVWKLIKWSVVGQLFNLIGTTYLILNDYRCTFVPYEEGQNDYEIRVYMNSLVVILYRIVSYFILIIAPLRTFWVKNYLNYNKNLNDTMQSSFDGDNQTTFFFRGLGHKRSQFDGSVISNIEDQLIKGSSPNQDQSNLLAKSDDNNYLGSYSSQSQQDTRLGKKYTNVEISETRAIIF
ncbi:hypothetical protein ABPG72_021833 [Tetrahymena utriculariae]